MTILLQGQVFLAKAFSGTTELSSRAERSVVEGPAVSFPGTHTRLLAPEGTVFRPTCVLEKPVFSY
jgi:hypothetical protein